MAATERTAGSAVRNQLLAALPPEMFKSIRPKMSAVTLTPKQTLHERNLPVRTAYFPTSGWISLVISFEDGFLVQTGLVGREGVAGVCLSGGADTEITEAVVQAPGEALSIEAADFRHAIETLPDFRRVILSYGDAMRAQAMQSSACNGHHSLEQRLARWLLMMDDRNEGGEIPVTQELLAMMLCVHRPSVTVAAGRLQREGLIRYSGGQMTIIDRLSLSRVSCECYRVIKKKYP